tara:strand:+ start:342 stop:545 length:204 start_codon:yes stop_codon:yes gene_type:complete
VKVVLSPIVCPVSLLRNIEHEFASTNVETIDALIELEAGDPDTGPAILAITNESALILLHIRMKGPA